MSQDPVQDGINWYTYADDNPTVNIDADGQYRKRRDKCEQWMRQAHALRQAIREHIDFMNNGMPRLIGHNKEWNHAKEVRQMQRHLKELLRKIDKDCDKKQKKYFGGEIGGFKETADCPVPDNPRSSMMPIMPMPMLPSIPPVPVTVPPPILVPVPI